MEDCLDCRNRGQHICPMHSPWNVVHEGDGQVRLLPSIRYVTDTSHTYNSGEPSLASSQNLDIVLNIPHSFINFARRSATLHINIQGIPSANFNGRPRRDYHRISLQPYIIPLNQPETINDPPPAAHAINPQDDPINPQDNILNQPSPFLDRED